MASVGKSQLELARRLCAAYISLRMGTRGVDFILRQMPKSLGSFWFELAALVTLRMRSGTRRQARAAPKTRVDPRGADEHEPSENSRR